MDGFFQPLSGMDLPRFAGMPTFFRLPHVAADHDRFRDVEIGVVGVPWDGGTTNRPGARHGPRGLRDATTMIRAGHPVTRLAPFKAVNCADVGDTAVNPNSLDDTLERVEGHFRMLADHGIVPLAMGGDHLLSLPALRGTSDPAAPLGMIHFDSHTDLYRSYFGGCRYNHGTPFRRVGPDPIWVSFDIDFLDPSCAPGTGTPEIGGPTTAMAQDMVRRLSGLDIRGADLVEVSPPLDVGGLTAWAGASMAFEILCPLAEAAARRRDG